MLRAVGPHDQVAIAVGQGLEPLPHPPGQPLAAGVLPLRDLLRMPGVVREPLVELRLVAVQHGDQAVELGVDVHDDVRLEPAGPGEGVGEVEDHRAGGEVRDVGADGGHGQQVGRVLDQQAGEAMVGVVVGRPVRDDQVRPEGPDQADHLAAVVQPVVELAVGMVEDLVRGADDRGGGLRLAASPTRQLGPGHRVVAGPPVGQAHQPDDVARVAPPGGRPAGLDVGVIRVGADDEDAQRLFSHEKHSLHFFGFFRASLDSPR